MHRTTHAHKNAISSPFGYSDKRFFVANRIVNYPNFCMSHGSRNCAFPFRRVSKIFHAATSTRYKLTVGRDERGHNYRRIAIIWVAERIKLSQSFRSDATNLNLASN